MPFLFPWMGSIPVKKRARITRPVLPEALERRQLLAADPAGDEFRVNVHTTNAQLNSAVAMDAQGNFVVVWQSLNQDGNSDGIFARVYSANGTPGSETDIQVNQFTTGGQTVPSVAMDNDGDFVVAWQSASQGGTGAEVWARRFGSNGTPAGDEFHVNTTTTGAQARPSVGMDHSGNFVIIWQGINPINMQYDIYAQRYSAAGATQGTEFIANTFTIGTQTNSAVAMDADGDFVVTWQSFNQDTSSNAVIAQRFDAAGAPQGVEFIVNNHTTNSQANPAVGMDDAGNFTIVWESNLQDGSGYGIYARRYTAAGVSIAPGEFKVNTRSEDQQRLPALAVDNDGDFIVTWASRLQPPPGDDSAYGIYAQQYTEAGEPDGEEFLVNTFTTGSQFNPSVAIANTEAFVITWQSDAQDGSGFGVFAQRYASPLAAPQVIQADFIWQNAPQRIEYKFNVDVSASFTNADITLQNTTTGLPIATGDISVAYDVPTNTATLTFLVNARAWLPDGRYDATLTASGITNTAGAPMAADHIFSFFFLQGDANHDALVNLQDFNRVAANFGQSPRDFTQGDFNYDALVSLADFNLLAGRFGVSLPAATSSSGSSFFGSTTIGAGATKKKSVASTLDELA